MAMVSKSHKFVYISGGRNATGSVKAGLLKIPNLKYYDPAKTHPKLWKMYDKHMPARHIKKQIGSHAWDDAFKFTFVRNTYSWVVSSYFFWVKIGRKKMPKNGIMNMKCFEEVVKYYRTPVGRRHDECSDIRSQHSYISDSNGNPMLDFVGRFEDLQNGFDFVCKQLDRKPISLTRQNKSYASKCDWKIHYQNSEAKKFVYKHWKRDIDAFGFVLEL